MFIIFLGYFRIHELKKQLADLDLDPDLLNDEAQCFSGSIKRSTNMAAGKLAQPAETPRQPAETPPQPESALSRSSGTTLLSKLISDGSL